ncbi:hypothetical protein ABZ897_42960 [Nonomuraea sp. NPDC046802]|uniref:hypothetical protein n=1 Tax=Nonomuraea sp. NPDC046802 TaxID=3154919 RepID=UPI0033DF7466
MSHPAADRQYLAAGVAMERRNVRSSIGEELSYAAERLQAVREKFADENATVFSGDTRRLLHAVDELHRRAAELDAIDRFRGLVEQAPSPAGQAETDSSTATQTRRPRSQPARRGDDERERRRRHYDDDITGLVDALAAYAREHGLQLAATAGSAGRRGGITYDLGGVWVTWVRADADEDLPPVPVRVENVVTGLRAEFDAVPPAAAVLGLVHGFRTGER